MNSSETREQKALAACIEAVAAATDIKRLKLVIGDSLAACREAWDAQASEADRYVSHIETAYAFYTDDEYEERVYLDDEAQGEIFATCPYCLTAHNAIQARKAARKRLGAARRAITMIGKVV